MTRSSGSLDGSLYCGGTWPSVAGAGKAGEGSGLIHTAPRDPRHTCRCQSPAAAHSSDAERIRTDEQGISFSKSKREKENDISCGGPFRERAHVTMKPRAEPTLHKNSIDRGETSFDIYSFVGNEK